MGYAWYIEEIASLFLAMGLFSGIAFKYDGNEITKQFLEGVKDIMSAALIVGLAGGILVILEDGRIIDTILYKVSTSMEGMGRLGTVSVMYVIQNIINVIIPSGFSQSSINYACYGTILRSCKFISSGNCNGFPVWRWFY